MYFSTAFGVGTTERRRRQAGERLASRIIHRARETARTCRYRGVTGMFQLAVWNV